MHLFLMFVIIFFRLSLGSFRMSCILEKNIPKENIFHLMNDQHVYFSKVCAENKNIIPSVISSIL